MANLFNITTATNSVTLDAQRLGKASFTVSNTSAASVRARARITAPDDSILPWFSIEGQAGRVLAPAETTQYTVNMTAPPTAAPKDYTFSLMMVDESNPDENFTEGPAVKLTVPAPVPVPEKKPFPWWIVAVAVVVVILVIGAIGLIVNQNVQANAHATGTALALSCKATTLPVPGAFSFPAGTFLVQGQAAVTVSLPQTNDQGHRTFPATGFAPPGGAAGFPACVTWSQIEFMCDKSTWKMLSGNVTTVLGACGTTLPTGIASVTFLNVTLVPFIF